MTSLIILIVTALVVFVIVVGSIASELKRIAVAMEKRNDIECKKAGINRYAL